MTQINAIPDSQVMMVPKFVELSPLKQRISIMAKGSVKVSKGKASAPATIGGAGPAISLHVTDDDVAFLGLFDVWL